MDSSMAFFRLSILPESIRVAMPSSSCPVRTERYFYRVPSGLLEATAVELSSTAQTRAIR